MKGEGRDKDFKVAFDPSSPAALLDLVKDIVAFANSGGGAIVLGRGETSSPGLSSDVAQALDSARVGDAVDKYTQKGLIHLRHDIEQLPNGRAIVTLNVDASPYPVVMSKDGTAAGARNTQHVVFRRGDVWVRHGSRTELVSQEDMRAVVQEAFQRGIDKILSAAAVVRDAGPGSAIEFAAGSPDAIRDPFDLLQLALSRRSLGLPDLLSGRELLWLFLRRHTFRPNEEQLELIIESALRRPPTLYWWLMEPAASPDMIRRILFRVPSAEDRDKSDAASSAVELSSIFLDPRDDSRLRSELAASRYAHFRGAVWKPRGRRAALAAMRSRVSRPKKDGESLLEVSDVELECHADSIAREEFFQPSKGRSRMLGDVLRALWLRRRRSAEE